MKNNGRCIGVTLGVVALCTVAMAVFAAPSGKPGEPRPQELYFDVENLNRIEGAKSDSFATPRATLEYFIRSSREGDFKRASQAFNLKHIPEEQRASSSPALAEKFFYVFSEKLQINFKDIPDRPDGELDPKGEEDQSHPGKPRRSIKIGAIGLDLWDAEVRLERLEVTGVKDNTMELRALGSAKDPPTAWRLHCRLRGELIAFVRDLGNGQFLPKHRLAWQPEKDSQAVAQHAPWAEKSDTKAGTL